MTRPSSRPLILGISLGLLLVLAIYAPLRHADFVYDDQWTIVHNPAIRSLQVLRFFVDPWTVAQKESGMAGDIYRPWAVVTFALDFHFWKLNPAPYHFENILLHMLNGLLFLWGTRQILKNDLASVVASLIFLIHPAQVESVAWVTQRSTLLCAVGCLASLALFLRAGPLSKARIWLIFAAWGFAVFSKETGIVWPAVVFLVDYSKPDPTRWRASASRMGFYSAWGMLAIGFLAIRHAMVGQWSSVSAQNPALWTQWTLGVLAFPIYMSKMLLPIALRVSYDFPRLREGPLVGCILFLCAYMFFLGWMLRRRTLAGLSLGWILLTLLPVLHVIPIVPFVAERFMYFPIMGWSLGLGWMVLQFPKTRLITGIWFGSMILLAALTVPRWQNEASLWADAIRQEPTNAFAHACYAQSLGSSPAAEQEYFKVLMNHPSDGIRYAALHNLASLHHAWGDSWKANYWRTKAEAVKP